MSKRMVQAMWDRLKEAPGEMWSEAKHMGAHGSHEIAAALFNGSPFVMYQRAPRDGQRVEDPQQTLPQEAEQQQERGGMEM